MDYDFMVLIDDLSMNELTKLMEDETKLNEVIMDDDRLKKRKLDREMVLAENRSIADDNLGKEPQLLHMKNDLGNKYNKLRELHEIYQMNRGKMASLSKEDNLDAMLAVLQAKLAETEENTEALAERLYSKGIGAEDFVSEFKQIRKAAHTRRAKIDKMRELILEMQRREVHNPPPPTLHASRHGSFPGATEHIHPTGDLPYPPAGSFSPHGVHQSSSFPQAHQAYPASQQYQQYQWQ